MQLAARQQLPHALVQPRLGFPGAGFEIGTQALLACQGAGAVYPAAAVNLTAAAEKARETLESDRHILIVCAGRDGAFSLDDAYCGGRLVSAVFGDSRPRRALNDAGLACLDLVRRYGDRWEKPLAYSQAGRELIRLGFRSDLRDAALVASAGITSAFVACANSAILPMRIAIGAFDSVIAAPSSTHRVATFQAMELASSAPVMIPLFPFKRLYAIAIYFVAVNVRSYLISSVG
jgi:hypothetical protein